MRELGSDSIGKLKVVLPRLEQELKNALKLKDFYQYTFYFAKNPAQKVLDLEMTNAKGVATPATKWWHSSEAPAPEAAKTCANESLNHLHCRWVGDLNTLHYWRAGEEQDAELTWLEQRRTALHVGRPGVTYEAPTGAAGEPVAAGYRAPPGCVIFLPRAESCCWAATSECNFTISASPGTIGPGPRRSVAQAGVTGGVKE
ncbi:hypothetical protein NDU88_005413 [Pleurodeles waltl]|uniref:Uncharacterized protein n=1 Tax=Pleurodeles waltl TaxID=8319 RepID=A0AAV7NS78_PLEWA|nr:hypothetical protein NDU88_005413 [Pleurodeles waltl]